MASPFDDLDRKRLEKVHASVELLVKQLARQQDQVDKLVRRRIVQSNRWGRPYLRRIIRDLRAKLAEQKLYVRQLENELRLRGLE
jgi:hypothetical protein